jgi:uncharacterized protein (DUF2141 family)
MILLKSIFAVFSIGLFFYNSIINPLIINKIEDNNFTLTVQINNCNSDKGKIMIALYNSADTYMNTDKAVQKKIVSIQNNKSTIRFENLPSGTYAFVFFHDANSNQKLDTNFMGIPKEGYGFSNDARGTFGAPSFSKSSFKLTANQTVTAKLSY